MSGRRPRDVHFSLTRTRYEKQEQVQIVFGHREHDSADGWDCVFDLVVVAVATDDDKL